MSEQFNSFLDARGKTGGVGTLGARIETSDLVYVAPVLKGYCETQLR